MSAKTQRSLEKKIKEIQSVTSGERDMYPYIRDLLTRKDYGIELRADQIVVDVAVAGGRDAPDLTVYGTKNGKPLKVPDHAIAIFEVKRGNALKKNAAPIYEEKKKYIQPGTKYFFLIDQERIIRRDVLHSQTPVEYQWDDLKDFDQFRHCFGCLSSDTLSLEKQLEDFKENKTQFASLSIDQIGRHYFIETIREVAQLLNEAISALIDRKVVVDLQAANSEIDLMKAKWGEPQFDWDAIGHPIEFERVLKQELVSELTQDDIAHYQEDHDQFASRIEPYLYALRIEHQLLQDYAERMGIESRPSLLSNRKGSNGKLTDSGRAVESFAYETASLIVSRMLMVRFSEDHGFLKRCISNGGVQVFANYAKYYNKPLQALLKETYNQSRDLYRNLFDSNLLDWALDSDDSLLSDSLLHSMYLLSRWDFKSIRGDILSGVYDHYLDTAKRRALGEVFTRPEIARYILKRCGYSASKDLLDPSCGTGTFIIEAFNQDVNRLRSKGALNEATIESVLQRLHGLDINPFSIALAQIQVLWHIIDLFAGRTPAEVKDLCAVIIPAIQIAGGHSSLDPLGSALAPLGKKASELVQIPIFFNTESTNERRKLVAKVSRRFRQISQHSYDIVAGNPPYVRPHRQAIDTGTLKAYEQVLHGVTDLYVYFIYRTLSSWLRDGGYLGFIVPMAVLESTYSGKLREILAEYKIVELIDLEPLGKRTFRGIKRQTVILIVQKLPASSTDDVAVTTLYPECYNPVTDTIEFTKAVRHTVKRNQLTQDYYLPDPKSQPAWMDLLQRPTGKESNIVTKLSPDDVKILEKFRELPRLGSIIKHAFMKQTKGSPTVIAQDIPEGENPSLWKESLMVGVALELGGGKALANKGLPIYKGQNIFPAGLRGEPMGFWDPDNSKLKSIKIYAYRNLFEYGRLYAIRDIAQLPTACPVPEKVAFQNTALMIQLTSDLPLHIYLLSRIPQWYAAKLLRATILEDFGCHWVKKQVPLLPIPRNISPKLIRSLLDIGGDVLNADKDLANAHRHVEALINGGSKKKLYELIANDDPRAKSLNMSGISSVPVSMTGLRDNGSQELVSDNLYFRFPVGDDELRKYLLYVLNRMVEDEPKITLGRDDIGNLVVPDDLTPVVTEIVRLEQVNLKQIFFDALDRLDEVVGHALGFQPADVDYIRTAMKTDGFLRELRPMLEQRGLRIQQYADHSSGDRYD